MLRNAETETRNSISSSNLVQLTNHAVKRSQQRGISHQSLELAVQFGKRQRERNGLLRRTLGRREIRHIRDLNIVAPGALDHMDGVSVITKEELDQVRVVTVMRIG